MDGADRRQKLIQMLSDFQSWLYLDPGTTERFRGPVVESAMEALFAVDLLVVLREHFSFE